MHWADTILYRPYRFYRKNYKYSKLFGLFPVSEFFSYQLQLFFRYLVALRFFFVALFLKLQQPFFVLMCNHKFYIMFAVKHCAINIYIWGSFPNWILTRKKIYVYIWYFLFLILFLLLLLRCHLMSFRLCS